MNKKQVTLKGILCTCIADDEGILFVPEFGKKVFFPYEDIVAIKTLEGKLQSSLPLLCNGKFAVVGKSGRSMTMNVFYKENRGLKRILSYLLGKVPGDVTFRKMQPSERNKNKKDADDNNALKLCPKCNNKSENYVKRKGLQKKDYYICTKCGHQF